MSTYGQIRHRVTKEVPGVDLVLLDGYLTDRYTAILDRLHWHRQKAQYIFQTVAPYSTGTLTLTNGANTVALVGGTFTSAMTSLSLVVGGRNETYVFTYVGATSGTLDRVFEGTTGSTYTFQLVQSVYPLPSTTRLFENAQLLDNDTPLEWQSRSQLNESLASRPFMTGAPVIVAPALDSSANPPQMQIELVPAPDKVYSIAVDLVSEASTSTGTTPASGTTLLPWVRPGCITAGACADAFAHLKEWDSSKWMESKYLGFLNDMMRTANAQSGPMVLTMGNYYTQHRRRRAGRSDGPIQDDDDD